LTEPALSPRLAVFADAIRRGAGEMSAEQRAHGLQKLNARRGRTGRGRRALVSLALAAALAVALVFSLRLRNRVTTLAYVVENGQLQGAGYVAPAPGEGARVRFSDGTRIDLDPLTRGRVAEVTAHGAQIALEDGEVHAHVVHHDNTQWLFNAGPFVVRVTGTAFDLRWSASQEYLEVAMHEGSVVVSGPVPAGSLTLSTHEKLTVRVRENEVLIRKVGEGEPPVEAPAPPTSIEAPPEPTPSLPVTPPKSAEPAPPSQGLSQLLSAGKLDAILAKVEERGLESFLSSASSEDLAALADAARYKRQDALAKRALLAQRERFPRSARARDAAFFLGRIAELASPGSEALRWYDRYLADSPGGLYAGEALGRKLALVQRTSPDNARPIAEEYLRRFPDGSYAKAARTLLDSR
jgi:hypothetical protein